MSSELRAAEQMTPSRRALVGLRKLRTRLDALERARREPIAITGMACRFPGEADDPDTYWQLLRHGVDAVSPMPRHRGGRRDPLTSGDDTADAPGPWGGYLDGMGGRAGGMCSRSANTF